MAELPAYSPQIQPESLPGRAYPHFPADVSPSDTGAAIGAGVESAGDVAEHLANRAATTARMTQIQDADNQGTMLVSSLTHDPQNGALTKQGKDAIGLTSQYLPKFDQGSQAILSGIRDDRVRNSVRIRLNEQRTALINQLDAHESNQQHQYGVTTAKAGIALAADAAAKNYNHPDILAQRLGDMRMATTNLSHQLGESDQVAMLRMQENESGFHKSVINAALEGRDPHLASVYLDHARDHMTAADLAEVTDKVKAGQASDLASNVMDAYRSHGEAAGAKAFGAIDKMSVDDETKDAVRKEVRAGIGAWREQQRESNMPQIMSLYENVDAGKAGLKELAAAQALFNSGALSGPEAASLRGRIRKKMDDNVVDESYANALRASLANPGHGLDPGDKSKELKGAADAVFAERTRGMPVGSDPWNNEAIEFYRLTNHIPPAYAGWLRTNIANPAGDPARTVQAAVAASRLMAANTGADLFEGDLKLPAKARALAELSVHGADPQEAVEAWEKIENTPEAQKDLLTQRWGKINNRDTKLQNALTEAYHSDERYTAGRGLFERKIPDMPEEMTAQFEEQAHSYYRINGGNWQQAVDQAAHDSKNRWGLTTVNGKREFMEYAPEAHGYTSDEVRADMTSHGLPQNAQLVANAATETTDGRWFGVNITDKNGKYDTLRGSDGRPRYYILPNDHAAFLQKQKEEKERLTIAGKQNKAIADEMERTAGGHPEFGL